MSREQACNDDVDAAVDAFFNGTLDALVDAAAAREVAVEDIIGNPTMQDQMRIEQLVAQNLTTGLQLLSENDLSNALDDFVNRDKSALENLIKDRLKETQRFVEENAADEAERITAGNAKDVTENVEKSIAEAVQQRLARSGATAAAQAAAADDATPANGTAPTAQQAAQQEKEIIEQRRRAAAMEIDDDGLGTVAASEQPSTNAFQETFNTQAFRGTQRGKGTQGRGSYSTSSGAPSTVICACITSAAFEKAVAVSCSPSSTA